MKFHTCLSVLSGAALCILTASLAIAAPSASIANLDLSGESPDLAGAVPVIAVDPTKENRVVVAWRFIAPAAKQDELLPGGWVCHTSISDDAGATFHSQMMNWGGDFSRCNAPYATISSKGVIYIGGTLVKELSGSAPMAGLRDQQPHHHPGAAVVTQSADDGKTWSPTLSVIASGTPDRFAPAPFLTPASMESPWDGARGVVDAETGALYVSGAFPAKPGGAEHSQRFFSTSIDGGRKFGPIRTFGTADWPERWDGDLAAAHGLLGLSYLAEATPDASVKCLCAVFAVSSDGGATRHRSLVSATDIDVDTLVHYPELAADNSRKGRFVMALISADKKRVSAFVTNDAGVKWRSVSPAQPPDVITVSRPAVAFTAKGVLILAWRGYHADGGYDIYAAARRTDGEFGGATRISSESSHLPDALKPTYALRGDFHTGLAAGIDWVHLAWADVRDGKTMRVVYARVPLSVLSKEAH